MWLLDANMNVNLVSVLGEFGIRCDSADERGWKTLTNGELVTAAVAGGFVCLLTRDRRFGQSASRALKMFPQFAVVFVNLPQLPSDAFRDRFVTRWMERAIEPVAGKFTTWP